MLSYDRAPLQLVAHGLKPKLLTILNFGNGYQTKLVNRSGENGGRENASGGNGRSASQQVGAPGRAVPGGFKGLNRDWRILALWKLAEGESPETNPLFASVRRYSINMTIVTIHKCLSIWSNGMLTGL